MSCGDCKPNANLLLFQLFEKANNVKDLLPIIDDYLVGNPYRQISGLFVMSASDVFNVIQKNKLENYKIDKKTETNDVLSFKLIRHIEKSNRSISGNMLVLRSKHPNVYFTVSDGNLEFIMLGMKRYFEELFPDVSTLKLSSKHLQTVLNNLERTSNFKIIADKTVANKRIYQNKRESAVTYTGINFKEVFERASEEDRWIDKINFSAVKEDNDKRAMVMNAFLSRSSVYRVSNNFSLFYKNIISDMCGISQTLYLLYTDRSRRKHNEVQRAKPLAIEFGYAVFDQPKKNKQLIDALRELTNSSVSVIHGNPYLHASVVDFLDGSSYDLWVLSQNKIIIVPQLRATYSSINRICDHIFRKFSEGEVKEFEVAANEF